MAIDFTAAEALAAESAKTFSDGLFALAQKAVAEAKQEHLRLAEEARRLEELRQSLEEDRLRLDRGFVRLSRGEPLEVSDSLPGSLSPIRRQTRGEPGSPLDIEADAGAGPGLHLPLCLEDQAMAMVSAGPSATVEHCQGSLTKCSDEALVGVLSGRRSSWEVAGNGGRVLVDFRPAALVAFLEQLAGDGHHQVHAGDGKTCELRLLELLDKFGMQGWVYQDFAQSLKVGSLLAYCGRRYAVLPPAGPDEAAVLLDMYDVAVTVPAGWEVLSTGQSGFDDVVGELSKHGWGTSLLCVKNAEGGFSSYRTTLYTHGGAAGSRVSNDSRVLQTVDDGGPCETFKFSKGMVLSGRVVICTKSQ